MVNKSEELPFRQAEKNEIGWQAEGLQLFAPAMRVVLMPTGKYSFERLLPI